jgi:hypothetical protein
LNRLKKKGGGPMTAALSRQRRFRLRYFFTSNFA